MELTEGSTMSLRSPHSTRNAFSFWDLRAPEGYVISLSFLQMEIGGSQWDDEDLFLYYGEDADNFDTNSDSGS